MYSQEVTIENKTGLHARPASLFVKTASKFKSDIMVDKNSKTGNAKSIISILSLGIGKGSRVKITADGPDENEAVVSLVELVKTKFGEE